jgi:hypothetical protein
MATRYWVPGGTGVWTSTTNWSATSGGPSGASIPTYLDDVVWNASSTSAGALINVAFQSFSPANCNNFTIDNCGADIRFGYTTDASYFAIYGNIYIRNPAKLTTFYEALSLRGTAAKTLDTDTSWQYYSGTTITVLEGSLTLLSALNNMVYSITVNRGASFSTNGYTLRTDRLYLDADLSASSGSIVCDFGASSVYLLNLYTQTYTQINAGTSTLYVGNLVARTNHTFYNFSTNPYATASSIVTLNGSSNVTLNFQTFSGKLMRSGSSSTSNNIINIVTWDFPAGVAGTYGTSGRNGTVFNVTNITGDYNDLIFENCVGTGALSTTSATRIGVAPTATGILGSPTRTIYRSYASGGSFINSTTIAYWAGTSGGTPDYQYNVLPQDTVIVDNNSCTSGATITLGSLSVTDVDMSARTLPFTMTTPGNIAFNVYGDLTLSSAMTAARSLASSSTSLGDLFLYGIAEQKLTFNGITVPWTCSINNPTQITLMDNVGFNNNTRVDLYLGTLALNGKTLSATAFRTMFSTAKTLSFGTGKLKLTNMYAGLTVFTPTDRAAIPNVSWDTGASLEIDSATFTTTFDGFSMGFPPTTIKGTGALTILGSNVFDSLTTDPATAHTIKFEAGKNNVFYAVTMLGSVGKVVTLTSTTTAQTTLTKPSNWNVGVNSTDGGNNTDLVFEDDGTIDYLAVSNIIGNSMATSSGSPGFFSFF